MFTPVRVRGKKPRKKLHKATDDRNIPTSSQMLANRPHGSSEELGSLESNPAPMDHLVIETPQGMKKPSSLSSLELLPLEILESIFFLSENVNLPMASAHIGSALASAHIKTEIVLQAFGNKPKYHFPKYMTSADDVEETPPNKNLQSALLRQKWLSYAFFQSCQKTFMLRNAIQCYRADASGIPHEIQASTVADITDVLGNTYDTDGRLRDQLRKYLLGPVPFERSGLAEDSDYRSNLMAREDSARSKFTWITGNGNERFIYLSCEGCHMVVSPYDELWYQFDRPTRDQPTFQFPYLPLSCEIPEKLLHGPWTNEKGHFLMLLLKHGASINWIDSTAGELAAKGLEDAIREDNRWAVEALVGYNHLYYGDGDASDMMDDHFGYFERPPRRSYEDSEIKEMVAPHSKLRFSYDWCHQTNGRKSVGVVPTTKHLRIAVLEKGCNCQIVKALLNDAPKTTIDCNDPDIIYWALQHKAEPPKWIGHGPWRTDLDEGSLLLEALDAERERQTWREINGGR